MGKFLGWIKDKESNWYYQKDDDYVVDGKEGVLLDILKFCGCGCPESAIKYVYGGLKLLNDRKDKEFENWREERNMYFNNNEGAEYFMWYYLEETGLEEHGTSTPGWLTEYGKEVLNGIEEYLDELKEDEENE